MGLAPLTQPLPLQCKRGSPAWPQLYLLEEKHLHTANIDSIMKSTHYEVHGWATVPPAFSRVFAYSWDTHASRAQILHYLHGYICTYIACAQEDYCFSWAQSCSLCTKCSHSKVAHHKVSSLYTCLPTSIYVVYTFCCLKYNASHNGNFKSLVKFWQKPGLRTTALQNSTTM